ncbi:MULTISPECIES: NtaA/DmoA family FMN-dependent monooxygenase [unclassified Mesorhizobium]|uniref:NtaA/DmoA family FMN-dependent monooxygenase n=1 Tax=unclassified Mesorhizobium TaxID=325217 RepID=UPI001FEE56CF|nr:MULTISPECIES: NtaA/DmoA family FMN-dependent monooxygenase [unclassified Mesorhizobium]
MSRKFHLGYFLTDSHAQAWATAWGGNVGKEWASPDLYVAAARELERACFDYVLIEDNVFVADAYGDSMDIYLRKGLSVPRRDPLMVAPYMLQATRHIGVVPTISTFAYHPYQLARLIGSLDQLSHGRAGWNVVTGSSERALQNFGHDGMDEHDARYDVADEFVEAANALWDSWDADAVVADRSSGVLIDPSKVRIPDYKGKHYATRGPLNSGPAPQGRPVMAQAGSSGRGRIFAARNADTIVVKAKTLDYARQYRQEIRELARSLGRDPDTIKLMLLIAPIIGATREEAELKRRKRDADDLAEAEATLAKVSKIVDIDFSRYPLDEPLKAEGLSTQGTRSVLTDFIARNAGRTLRQAGAIALAYNPDGTSLAGTAQDVAREMVEIMEHVGGDGFLVSGQTTRHFLAEVVDGLVPALQDLGAVRNRYAGGMLRDNLMEF